MAEPGHRLRTGLGTLAAVAALVASGGAGCVLPTVRLAGMELAWSFVEANADDGAEQRRHRTCAGVDVGRVEVLVADQDDETRRRVFPYDCEAGYLTPEEANIVASDLFLDLDQGRYDVRLQVFDLDSVPVMAVRREVLIEDRGINVQGFELALPVQGWSLTLGSVETCESVRFSVRYADPETDLADMRPDEDPLDVVYRTGLVSSLDLPLDGQDVPCADAGVGPHNFVGLDRGRYVLDVAVDGTACAVPFEVARTAQTLTLDLANLPCEG